MQQRVFIISYSNLSMGRNLCGTIKKKYILVWVMGNFNYPGYSSEPKC